MLGKSAARGSTGLPLGCAALALTDAGWSVVTAMRASPKQHQGYSRHVTWDLQGRRVTGLISQLLHQSQVLGLRSVLQ